MHYRPVGRRFDFPRFSVPPTASLRLAPHEASCSVSLRFHSRVFSTPQRFPSTPKFRGLVSCRNQFLGSSLQSIPLVRIARPSRGRFASLPLSTVRAEPYCPSALSPPVSPTPALLTQLPGSHERLWTPFSRAETRFPVVLDSAQQNRSIPPASPTSKLLSPHKSVRDQPELPRPGGRYSLGFAPLYGLLRPRLASSDPPRPRGPEHAPPPEGFGPATPETSSLKSRVKPS
jgi:hypothetical protein